mgnify:CR=1 FL=1
MNPRRLFTLYRRAQQRAGYFEEASVSKSLFLSKIFWFNVLTATAGVFQVIPLPPEYTAVAIGLINIGLRFVTATPVHIVPPV